MLADSPPRGRRRGLDPLGRLELAALGLWYGGVFGLATTTLTTRVRELRAPDSLAWLLGASAALLTFVVVQVAVSTDWRKHGGRAVQRLGRTTWRTGRLPHQLPSRIAVLRDLERRERKLLRTWLPAWVSALVWGVFVAFNIADRPAPLNTVSWLLLWTVFLGHGIVDFHDRRSLPRLTRLIAELRANPLPPTRPER